jgi:hypothetical protein
MKAKLKGAKRSTTIWFNALAALAVLLLPEAQNQFTLLQPYLDETLYRWAMGIITAGNILLRFKTVASLAEKAPR